MVGTIDDACHVMALGYAAGVGIATVAGPQETKAEPVVVRGQLACAAQLQVPPGHG